MYAHAKQSLLPQPNPASLRLARLAFLLQVGAGAAGQFLEVHLVRVEFRAVDAGELHLAAHRSAAAASGVLLDGRGSIS